MFDLFWGRGTTIPATRIATTYLFNVLSFVGLNPTKKWRKLHFFYSVIINLCVLVLLPLAFTLSYCFKSAEMSTAQFMTSLQVVINVYGLPPKFLTVLLNIKRLRSADEIMDTLDERCHLEEERRKIRRCIKTGNRLPVLFCFIYLMYSLVTLLSSIMMRQPPYSLYMPLIDWRKSTPEFCIQTFIEFLLMDFICLNQSMDDVYAVIYIKIMRHYMKILVERVKRLGSNEHKSKEENYQELVQCIKDHKNLLRLYDTVGFVISITLFVQFTIAAAITGITLINFFIFANTSEQVASAAYFLAVQLQTAPCCYQATCLIDDAEQLPVAILHCNWMGEDKRFRKMLLFFMHCSQKPMVMTAMKLFPITLNTNLGIAKFSFSLYTLIKEMDFGQQLNK